MKATPVVSRWELPHNQMRLLTLASCILATVWTGLFLLSMLSDFRRESRSMLELAKAEAEASFEKEVLYRQWAFTHGATDGDMGVPASIPSFPTNRMVTNPDLEKRISWLSSARISQPELDQSRSHTHLTSLNPFRLRNAPDAWETNALRALARGQPEVAALDTVAGKPYLRLIRGLFTERSCLRCHEEQGYKLGELRGGLSVAVSMAPYEVAVRAANRSTVLVHGGFWLAGMASLGSGYVFLRRRLRERDRALARLQATEAELAAKKQSDLLEASRLTGKAEMATGILHNVGNVLNSVNISASLLQSRLKESKAAHLAKAAALLRQHQADLSAFLTHDPKGRHLPAFLEQLAGYLAADQAAALNEVRELTQHVEHLKEIVATQQSYAKPAGIWERQSLPELLEEALRLQHHSLLRNQVQVLRHFDPLPALLVDRHKVLQLLVNLLTNAQQALDASTARERRLVLSLHQHGQDRVRLSVADNGVGIAPENLTRIFSHGFTTKKEGHGFGLHSAALMAREMGGSLSVQSAGQGQGATFTLELPLLRSEYETEPCFERPKPAAEILSPAPEASAPIR